MKIHISKASGVLALLALLLTLNFDVSTACAQGTAFTYDGLLEKGSAPQSGTFNFTFTLYDVVTGGSPVAATFITNGVPVKTGAFTVTMDFGGAVWNGETNWLEISVEANGDAGPTMLTPRQQVMPTPYAIFAETASNLSGTLPIAQLDGTINNSQLANSSITINTGTGLSGGGSPVALGGSITLNNTGVTSLTGGDGVTVSGTTGNVTLGLGSSLTLANLPVAITTAENGWLLSADMNGNYFAGVFAGNPVQPGVNNTAEGSGALQAISSGVANTANGEDALQGNNSGSENTANGSGALSDNRGGSYNVADGANSLGMGMDGWYNTAVGANTLSEVTSKAGSNNIAIGYQAGSAFNGIESSNIDIGNIGVGGESGITRIGTPGIQTAAYIAGIITGNGSGLTSLNASQLTSGTINNSQLANSSITINTGAGLSSSGSPVALGGTITLNNTGVTSLTGGDGVTVSGATGDLTLGLGTTLSLTGTLPVSMNTQNGTLLYVDFDGNYYAGLHVGNSTSSGADNTAIGNDAFHFNNDGADNAAFGANALSQSESGTFNTALGPYALSVLGQSSLAGGSNNIAIGYQAGNAYSGNESSNIDIGNVGVTGDGNVIRIGNQQAVAYIAGIITGNGSGLTSLNGSQITGGTINNSQLANSSITINTGTGLSASGSPVALGGTITLNNTGVTSLTGGGGVTVSASSGAVTLGSTATSLNVDNTIVSRDGTGSFAAQNLTLAGVLNLPAPPVTINSGASSLLLGDGNRDLFVGLGAGNLTSGAGDNTALGYESLQAVTSGNQNVAVGSYSLADDTTGNLNVGVGYLALQQNTDGFGNTACGWESLRVNTDGWYDTGVGTWALQANTTGNNNTAVGYDALGGNTTGTENTAYGVHANLYNETGSNNVAVGWWSLNYCPGGSSNIAVGYEAGINFEDTESGNIDIGNAGEYGDNNTIRIGSVNNAGSNEVANTYIAGIWAVPVSSGLPVVVDSSGHLGVQASSASYGSGNTADGYQALSGNTSGTENVAVGALALAFNTNGGENTACGVSALQDNTSGSYNTAIGQGSLAYNYTGTFNTAVGADALQQLSSGTGNIAIGAEAGSQMTGNFNDDIDIGNMGEVGDNNIIRIGSHGIQTDAYIAGVCNTDGFGCKQGVGSQVYGNAFNFWWSGSQLSAYVDITDIGTVNVTVSDRRLKENIEPMTDDALTRVMALKPSSFKYKNIPGNIFHGDDQTKEGFIADELQQVIPSAVNGEKDALTSKGTIQPQTLNLMPVVAVLTKAVQDQQKEIDDLKAMVKTLSARK